MITVTYPGLGSSLYEGGASLQYDNHYVGAIMANWTRGVAKVQIRAAGPVGRHTIEVADAISFDYLNIPQSPIPWATGSTFTFTVTKDAGRPKNRHRLAGRQWRRRSTRRRRWPPCRGSAAGKATATRQLDEPARCCRRSTSPRTGLTPSAPVSLVWSTVVGNRVNCTGTCWSFVSVPLGNGTAGADGTLKTHDAAYPTGSAAGTSCSSSRAATVKAQVPYYVKRSIVGNGVSKLMLKAGQPFTIHLKGARLDAARQHDRRRLRQQLHRLRLRLQLQRRRRDATSSRPARPGTHLIDMYPLLYTQQPSYANTPYGMVPVLTYARDVAGPRARLPAAGDPPGDRGRQVGSLRGEGRKPLPTAGGAHERRNGALRLLERTQSGPRAWGCRGPLTSFRA